MKNEKTVRQLIEGIISIGAGVHTISDPSSCTGYLSAKTLNEIMKTPELLDGYQINTAYPLLNRFVVASKTFKPGHVQHMQLWDVDEAE